MPTFVSSPVPAGAPGSTVTNIWYGGGPDGAATKSLTTGQMEFGLAWLPSGDYDEAAVLISGAGASGDIIRLGVYHSDGLGIGTLHTDLGQFNIDASTGQVGTTGLSLSIGHPGFYWIASVMQVQTGAASFERADRQMNIFSTMHDNPQTYNHHQGGWKTDAATYTGALPTGPISVSDCESTDPIRVFLRAV